MDETVINRLSDVTFVMPVRIDSIERSRNLDVLIDFVIRYFSSNILIMEMDSHQRYFVKKENPRIQYFFQEDSRPIFQHTLCLNLVYPKVDTPIIAGWDTDAWVAPEQIIETVNRVRSKNAIMGLPYDGNMYRTTRELARLYRDTLNPDVLIREAGRLQTMYGDFSTGGAFVVDTEKYLKAGGENEYFLGWGPEDLERVRRMEILHSQPVYYAKGGLFHLWHPRYLNSGYADRQYEIAMKKEYLKVCGMSRYELRNYIKTWPWLGRLQKKPDNISQIRIKENEDQTIQPCKTKKYRLLAFYLPQFHPIPENDQWWGKGFTEWTNTGKAKPLFRGHYQPRVPADLGYYDLRLPEVRESQAALAKEAGIEGFCYWHYWFGNGKRLLERPFNEVLTSGKPDFPFCLGWANEAWKGFYHGIKNRNILIDQQYFGIDDYESHFHAILPALSDHRYIRINGKPLFYIFKPLMIADVTVFTDLWQKLALQNGLDGIYFVGQSFFLHEKNLLLKKGFNAVNLVRLWHCMTNKNIQPQKKSNTSIVYRYVDVLNTFVGAEEKEINMIPTIIPNWDHSPRCGRESFILHHSTPELFEKHLIQVLETIQHKPEQERIAFIKSWNEWAEGNYLEPDLIYGKSYLNIIRKNLLIAKE